MAVAISPTLKLEDFVSCEEIFLCIQETGWRVNNNKINNNNNNHFISFILFNVFSRAQWLYLLRRLQIKLNHDKSNLVRVLVSGFPDVNRSCCC